jgi:putative peptidoglycan lipid II flippase
MYADRLYQLPLGVVGVAIGVVLLPDLSRRLQSEDTAGGQAAFSRAGEICLLLTIPAAVALAVIPTELVSVLFERGAFTASDSAATAFAVAVYGLGLPAFVLQKVLQPLFFARENTRAPFHYALVSLVVNAAVSIGLAPFIGYIAAALGAVLAAWSMVWLLWRGSRDMGQAAEFDARFLDRLWRIVLASLAMGIALFALKWVLAPMFEPGAQRYFALTILVVLGGASYFIAGRAFKAFSFADLKSALKR